MYSLTSFTTRLARPGTKLCQVQPNKFFIGPATSSAAASSSYAYALPIPLTFQPPHTWRPHLFSPPRTAQRSATQTLHECRLEYILQQCQLHELTQHSHTLAGCTVLEVGCGSGVLTQALSRHGGEVHGIDTASSAITAQSRSTSLPTESTTNQSIRYSYVTPESLLASTKQYDLVCAFESLDHVTHLPSFINTLCALVKPGGLLFLSATKPTIGSYLQSTIRANSKQYLNRSISSEALTSFIQAACHPYYAPFRTIDQKLIWHTPTIPPGNDFEEEHLQRRSSSAALPTLGFQVTHITGVHDDPSNGWQLNPRRLDSYYMIVAKRDPPSKKTPSLADRTQGPLNHMQLYRDRHQI